MENNQDFKRKVLILGNDTRSFLSVIRSLGRQEICVHVGWCEDNPAIYSKYISKIWKIPPYSPTDNSWKVTLLSILKRERFQLVIPCHDSTIIPLQYHRTELETEALLYLLSDHAFQIVNDKFRTYDLAENLGINVPRRMRIGTSTLPKQITKHFHFPVVVKPRSSYTLKEIEARKTVKKIITYDELVRCLDSIHSNEKFELYEHFAGTGVGIEVLALEGKILFAFQHIRVHEPLRGGGSSYRKSAPVQEDLLKASAKLIESLNYTGVAMIEYKVDLKTNIWRFIEINGRFWGSLPLAISAGADFPYFLYQMMVEGRKAFPRIYKTGIYCRALTDDLYWLNANLFADHNNIALSTRPLSLVCLEILNFFFLRERSDTLVIDDPLPGLVEIKEISKWFFRKASALFASKWNAFSLNRQVLKTRALSAFKKSQCIGFVCKGNICRSPFALHYFKSNCKGSLKAISCGYYPEMGRRCTEEAVVAARKIGVDLTTHSSEVISKHFLDQVDMVFVFDDENRSNLIRLYPEFKEKVFRIGSLDLNVPITIEDPYGKSLDFYEKIYRYIAKCLDNLKV